MSDRTERLSHKHLFLHHLSPAEKVRIFKECHIRLNWYKESIIQRTKERLQQEEIQFLETVERRAIGKVEKDDLIF
jgi:hypothetical protein